MTDWQPDPKVQPLLAAIRRAEARLDRQTRNQRRGYDEDGRAPLFESLLPNSRGSVSPLGGQAKPKAEAR
jgi:hypothetical protein